MEIQKWKYVFEYDLYIALFYSAFVKINLFKKFFFYYTASIKTHTVNEYMNIYERIFLNVKDFQFLNLSVFFLFMTFYSFTLVIVILMRLCIFCICVLCFVIHNILHIILAILF